MSQQLVHGVLYVFWQLKRQVDVIGYLVERACLWRKATPRELREVEQLRTGSDGLEWFQDFYAAFIAIILQVYSLGSHWLATTTNDGFNPNKAGASFGDSASRIALSQAGSGSGSPSEGGELLRNLVLKTQILEQPNTDLLILSEIMVSSAAIISLLIAVRRKDDGSLTMALSMLGWGSIFAARIIIIALGFVHLGWKWMLTILVAHLIIITYWVYNIAIDSHNDKPSENAAFIWQEQQNEASTHTGSCSADKQVDKLTTSNWFVTEHATLITQILALFAIPSIFYWPIMFNLRLHYRPQKYLSIILSENFLLILAVALTIGVSQASPGQWYLLSTTAAFSIIGFIFVSLYVCCKPSLTEYFARADQILNGAEQAGIYFELCSRVFKMPDLSGQDFRRLLNQTEEQVEVQ